MWGPVLLVGIEEKILKDDGRGKSEAERKNLND
jgi:hypothetical protein